jgi:uncharacterized protein YigA (DUF484 family)
MTEQTLPVREDWRDRVLSDPDMILDDRDLMRALIAADAAAAGTTVVDLRAIAIERLETRLDRLEDTHRSVVAAAYENLAGTNQVHRCVLGLLAREDFGAMLSYLADEMPDILRVNGARLVLESAAPGPAPHSAITVVTRGFIRAYLSPEGEGPARDITLRPCAVPTPEVHGARASEVRSEALLRLDLGAGRLGGLLAFGSADPHRFRAGQGTELTSFLGAAFAAILRRHLG